MSQENVEIARRVLDAFNSGGVKGLVDAFDPEIVWHTDPHVPEPGVYEGRDTVLAYLEGYIRAFGGLRFDIHDLRDLGEGRVFALTTFSGEPGASSSGRTQMLDWAFVANIRKGKVTQIRSFLDKDRALEAAGLSE